MPIEEEELKKRRWELLFSLRWNVLYHELRRDRYRFWACVQFGIPFVCAVATFSSLAQWNLWVYILAIICALFVLVSPADLKGRAEQHEHLRCDYIDLQQKASKLHLPEKMLEKLVCSTLEIQKREPDSRPVLSLLCHNRIALSEYGNRKHCYRIPFWKRLLAHSPFVGIDGIQLLERDAVETTED